MREIWKFAAFAVEYDQKNGVADILDSLTGYTR